MPNFDVFTTSRKLTVQCVRLYVSSARHVHRVRRFRTTYHFELLSSLVASIASTRLLMLFLLVSCFPVAVYSSRLTHAHIFDAYLYLVGVGAAFLPSCVAALGCVTRLFFPQLFSSAYGVRRRLTRNVRFVGL